MRKYTCSVCGYVFEEKKGLKEAGVAPGTKWEDIPDSFVCPLCSAPKSAFVLQKDEPEVKNIAEKAVVQIEEKLTELSNSELSIVFSNFAKGCEKQYKPEEQKLFLELSDYFRNNSKVKEGALADIENLIERNITSDFPQASQIASAEKDRGALRTVVWSEKVTAILKFILERYKQEGSKFLESNKIYVCEICGFIYVGNELPDICPICKVPKEKIHEVL